MSDTQRPRLIVATADLRRIQLATRTFTDADLGSVLGFDAATVRRVRAGREQPSGAFIAAVLTVTGLPFEDAFTVI